MDWLLQYFYYEGDLLKTGCALIGFFVLLCVVLDACYIIRSGSMSVK